MYSPIPPQKQGQGGIIRSEVPKGPAALLLPGQRASAFVKSGFNVQTATRLFLIVQNVSFFKRTTLHLVPITGLFLRAWVTKHRSSQGGPGHTGLQLLQEPGSHHSLLTSSRDCLLLYKETICYCYPQLGSPLPREPDL